MAGTIDMIATEPHFVDHLAPVWLAIPAEHRGAFCTTPLLAGRVRAAGIEPTRWTSVPAPSSTLTVAASYGDMKRARAKGRPVVLCEHGAGQSYAGVSSGSYVGAPDRAGVAAVLVPSAMAARRHSAAHPAIAAHVVGCPKLDRWHRVPRGQRPGRRPVVAVSFHWDAAGICPEARSAWPHYRRSLGELASRFHVIGHAHPRAQRQIAPHYRRHGITMVADFADVLDRADLYVCDNSSTLYEFASTDRPVVVLNSPLYRRDVEHGLRFWSHADVGFQVDAPADLADAVAVALTDPPAVAARRRDIVADVYVACDGAAAARAATAVLSCLAGVERQEVRHAATAR